MNTIEYLDAAKKRLGVNSDYALYKKLDIPQTTVSGWRSKNRQFSVQYSKLFAKILDIPEGVIMADMESERATDTLTKNAWAKVAKQLQAIAASLALVAVIGVSTPQAEAAYSFGFESGSNMYYAHCVGAPQNPQPGKTIGNL